MPDLVKYSKIEKRMSMKFLKKKYIENDYSVLYDVGKSGSGVNLSLLYDIKNLILNKITSFSAYVIDIKAKNIYFLDEQNLGGITIPFKTIMESKKSYRFIWDKTKSNIDKINVIYNNNIVKTFNFSNLKDIFITRRKADNKMSVEIENDNSIIEYIIDELGNIETYKKEYNISNKDIKNNSIELKDFIDYNDINVDINNGIKIKYLIIDKECIKRLYKFLEAITYINYDLLVIKDNNDMKLFPNTIILGNISPKIIEIFQNYNNEFYIVYEKKKIIYLNNNEIKVIDKGKLLNDERIDNIQFYLEDDYHLCKHNPIIITKYKNNKTKICGLKEEIEINKLFNIFNILNIYDYYHHDRKEIEKLLLNNDWYNLFNKRYINYYNFKKIYEDYLIFLEKIKTLHDKGFSYKAIIYMYENGLDILKEKSNKDNLIYQNGFNLNEISKDEINKFNELGSLYIKRKRLTKSR